MNSSNKEDHLKRQSYFRESVRNCLLLISIVSLCNSLAADCDDDECGGIWWSRGGSRIALIAGGAIVVGGIAGAIAGNASSKNTHDHHSRSLVSTENNQAVNPLLLPEINFPVAAQTMPANGLTEVDGLTGIDLTNGTNLGINTTVNLGEIGMTGNVDPTREGVIREKTIHSFPKSKSTGSSAFAKNKASAIGLEETLTFNFTLACTEKAGGMATILPFIVCPDDSTIEGSPTTFSFLEHPIAVWSIPIPSMEGTYQVGIDCLGSYLQAPLIVSLETIMIDSQHQSTIFKGNYAGLVDRHILHEFIYTHQK